MNADAIRRTSRPYPWSAALWTIVCLLVATSASLLFVIANGAYFALVEGLIDPVDPMHRALLYSSWSLIVGGAIVIWRPRAFGFQVGRMTETRRLIVSVCVAAAMTTAVLLAITGPTPYSAASAWVEVVLVPFTEELVFRGVLLTVLLIALGRIQGPERAVLLAVVINGIAFGLAHLANAAVLDLAFVLPQAAFASVLGIGCAYLMAKSNSIYPAILLHAVVNGVVVAF